MNLPPAARINTETMTAKQTPTPEPDPVPERVRAVRTSDPSVQDDALRREPWIGRVMHIEGCERKRRVLERRLTYTRISDFTTIADFGCGALARSSRQRITPIPSAPGVFPQPVRHHHGFDPPLARISRSQWEKASRRSRTRV